MKHNELVKYRPDIDGLRAVAVLSVVIFHAFPSLITGGFVGVDVFFVISGYLISSILFKNLEKGTFSFFDFYSRRIRRIFPALIVVLFFCLTTGYFILLGEEYKQLGRHAVAGSLFFSNIALLKEFADYFDAAAELKPLLHLWSLGIEEQFYIFWPLTLYLAWRFGLNLFLVTLLTAIVSFVWNIAEFRANPVYSFYLPNTRVWELLLGAVLAWLQIFKVETIGDLLPEYFRKFEFSNYKISASVLKEKKAQDLLSLVGFALILVAVLFYNKETSFPRFAALLPVVGAILIIVSGPHAIVNKKILSLKPVVFIGLISFPLYLWHWPLLSFATIVESGTPAQEWRIIAVFLAFLLSVSTWHFLEKNLRFKEGKPILGLLIGLVIIIVLLGQDIYKRNGWEWRIKEYKQNAQIFEGWQIDDPACVQKFKSKFGDNIRYCLIGSVDRDPDAILMGDSHANSLAYGLIRKFSEQGSNLLHMGTGGCPPFFGMIGNEKWPCEKENKALEILEKDPRIKTVLMNSSGPRYVNLTNYEDKTPLRGIKYQYRPDILDPKKAFQQAFYDSVRRFTKAGKDVVYIADFPELDFDPKKCVPLRPFSLESVDAEYVCRVSRKDFDDRNKEYHEIIKSIQRDFPKMKVWNAWENFCDQIYCYAVRDNKLLYRDSHHISLEGSYWLGEKYDPK
ncbi:acyltransferase family protein [Leptospira andrefontaineae]|uniref:Acyltransferase n=1 Tax=Leptospira andrefontaineae TaxID=2484976 RepID=A0A4R9HCJ4_9LEPT|nr:acyltransferase family protein [Leptospira andrefontaineae]TGK44556.1 acyltransferase [Leptospira andrefontaineae]